MSNDTTTQMAYDNTSLFIPMFRLQGLMLSALIERNVISRGEAKSLVQEAANFIPKLQASDGLKDAVTLLFSELKSEL